MKQTYFSMNYANRALKIFQKFDEYDVQALRCQFIVAGNLIDSLEFERALQQFLNALEIAEYTKILHLVGMSQMNIGICYEELKDYNKVAMHLRLPFNIFEKSEHSFLTKALFAMAHVYAKKNNFDIAYNYFILCPKSI